ncbi:MAG: hypothetical protein WCP86_03645 [bacterium]
MFGLSPDEFIRVEFRGVSREAIDMEAGMCTKELFDCVSPVNRAVVP